MGLGFRVAVLGVQGLGLGLGIRLGFGDVYDMVLKERLQVTVISMRLLLLGLGTRAPTTSLQIETLFHPFPSSRLVV